MTRLNVGHAFVLFVLLANFSIPAPLSAGVLYNDPDGGWTYTYDGDVADGRADAALDGTWDRAVGV